MKIATAFVELRVDRAKAESEAKSAADAAFGKMKSVFAAGLVIAGIKEAIGSASRLEQAVGATAAVFGTASKQVDAFARSSAKSFGISESAARELTSQIGALLQNFGFTAEEAAGLSTELASLGADLAAAFGGSPEEAVSALGAALRGETDPVERFGISLNEAKIKTKAFELGLYSGTGALEGNAKAQAALALISEQTAKVTGQAAREADTAAGQQARAQAQLEDAAAKAGQALLPVYARAAELVGTLATKFADLPGPVQSGVLALGAFVALSGPISTAKGIVVDLAGAFKKAGTTASVAAGLVGGFAAALTALQVIDALRGDFADLTDEMNQFLTVAGPKGEQATVDVANAFGELANAAFDAESSLALAGDGLDVLLTGADKAEKFGEAMDKAFTQILGQSPEMAQKVVDSLYLVELAADRGSTSAQEWLDAYGLSSDRITEFQTRVDNAVGATEALTGVTGEAAEVTGDLGDAQEDARDKFRAATDAALAQREAIADLYDEMLSQIDVQRAYERSIDDSEQAIADYITTLGDQESTEEDVQDAARNTADQLIDTAKAYAELNAGSTTSKAGVDAMIESLFNQAVKLGADDPLRKNLLDYIAELQKIPTKIDTAISLKVTGQTVNINPSRAGDVIGIRAIGNQAVASAQGRYVPARSNLLSTFGEQGAEAILPLDKPNRLVELLGDPRIGGPIGEALGVGGSGPFGAPSGGGSTTVINNLEAKFYGAERTYLLQLREDLRQLEREQR